MGNFADLKYRLIILSICSCVLAFLIYFSNHPVVQFIVVMTTIAFAVTAIWEYYNLLKAKKIVLPFWLLSLVAVAYLLANYLAILKLDFSIGVSLVIAAFFFGVFLYNFYRVEGAIVNIALSFFGALYIVVPLGCMLGILYPESITTYFNDGRLWFTYLIGVTKITDMGAYFIGKMWGKSKLAPHLSPGKTLLGAVGGFFAAVLLSLGFHFVSNFCPESLFRLTLLQALILGGLVGIFSQLGDLAESLLKRDAKIKDSNHIPGIGGALDLLDSLLFTTPLVYLFLRAVYVS